MICPTCRKAVPDESVFCLACGARLPRAERRAPVNGDEPAAATSPGGQPTVAPGSKQPYTLSFQPLPDERLRYRVARWVCEVAPAHEFSEVQEGLMRGTFSTYLALSTGEAETARERIRALGVHAAAVRLTPAASAEMLLPSRPGKESKGPEWTTGQKFLAVAILLAVLFLSGVYMLARYQAPGTVRGEAPTIGGKP